MTGVCKKIYILKIVLIQPSISLMGNTFLFKASFKWLASVWNLEKSDTIEKVQHSKVKTRPILYW